VLRALPRMCPRSRHQGDRPPLEREGHCVIGTFQFPPPRRGLEKELAHEVAQTLSFGIRRSLES
jgi:hypothetical protein